jgi:ABC-type lipoprotein release transport system permease subunit
MIKNYLKIGFRNILKNRSLSLINVGGLALALVVSMFILLWVRNEMSYDQFHEKADRLYYVMNNMKPGSSEIQTWTGSPAPYHRVLKEELPEVENSSMFYTYPLSLTYRNEVFRDMGLLTTPSILEMLDYPLALGNAATCLEEPNSVVLMPELAEKFFGPNWRTNDQVLGALVEVEGGLEMSVSGVFEPVPGPSTLDFSFMIPIEAEFQHEPEKWNHWGNYSYTTLLLLTEGSTPDQLDPKLMPVIEKRTQMGKPHGMFLQPLTDRYLHSQFKDGQVSGGRIVYVRIFSAAALLLLLIAGINYMNLATATATTRAKEVGIRKVSGAPRSSLAGQFLTESVLTAGIATLIAATLGFLCLPFFATISGKDVSMQFNETGFWMWFGALGIGIGLLSGLYPAFLLSGFHTAKVIKGKLTDRIGGLQLRRALVILQFAMSIILIISALSVRSQIHYIMSKDLGFQRENVLTLTLSDELNEKYDVIKEALDADPAIASVGRGHEAIFNVSTGTGDPTWEGMDESRRAIFKILFVDELFFRTVNLQFIAGEGFRKRLEGDSTVNLVINETAARQMGFEDPIGKRVSFWGDDGRVIGVVKDFHNASLHSNIQPLIFYYQPLSANQLYVRTAPGQTKLAVNRVEKTIARLDPDNALEYQFLDQQYESLYREELRTGKLADIFALLAIIISCLGLLGLAVFNIHRRVKEIGVRKVLGASVLQIAGLLSREFIILVAVAFVIGLPVARYLVFNWLEQFTYHTQLGWLPFALAGLGAILLALLTVGVLGVRAASANPVKSLRSE